MEIPFVGGAYSGRSKPLNAQECQNFYLEADMQNGKKPLSLIGTPGMRLWLTSGIEGEVRALYIWKSYLYAVIGSTLYKIDTQGKPTNVGTIGTSTGGVWIAGGTTHLCIVDGIKGYYKIASATSLTEITDADFPTPTSLTYQDGYFIVTEEDTDAFYISGSEDASSWDALEFASAEDTPDDALVGLSHKRELWIFGEQTTEVFYNSGDSDFPFSRVAGGVFPMGIGAVRSVVSDSLGLLLLDDKYRVQFISGYQWQIVSTSQVEYHICSYSNKDGAIGYSYSQEGHTFYVLTFPGASKTWCYDLTTGVWSVRSSGLAGGRHRSNCHAWFAGKNLVGDMNDGNIYEFDLGYYKDNADAIRRIRAAQAIHQDRKLLFHNQLEVEFEPGVGLATGQGSDPQVMLDWSDDGAKTWSNEHWTTIGAIGEYQARAIWRRLGRSRSRTYRVTITDPVKCIILGAHIDAQSGIA